MGSFRCGCFSGYRLASNGFSCSGTIIWRESLHCIYSITDQQILMSVLKTAMIVSKSVLTLSVHSHVHAIQDLPFLSMERLALVSVHTEHNNMELQYFINL